MWLDTQCITKRVLVVSIFLGYHFVPRVNRPIYIPKNRFREHLQLKPMVSVFTYILITDKTITTKFNSNIKQVNYYIMVYN